MTRSRDPLGFFHRPSKEPGWNKPHSSGAEGVPEWAGFFSTAEYEEFIRLIGAHFEARGEAFRVEDGVVDVDGSDIQFGLGNLAQMCHQQSRADWPELISAHFAGLVQAKREEEELEDIASDFEKVRKLLSVRLFPRAHLGAVGPEKLIMREDMDGVLSVLVFDMPASVRSVLPEQAESWGLSHAELLAMGLENVWQNLRVEARQVDIGAGVGIRLISGPSFMTATHALLLDRHPGCVGPFGALVGVPHRHAVVAFPMVDRRTIAAVGRLLPAVSGMEKEGPGSISPCLYWYHDKTFTNLPYTSTDEGFRFMVPKEFLAILEKMPPAPGER